MKNFKSNRKNVGAAGIASKACAWILSIMLVVTGMAPSFAANTKADKDGAVKTAAKARASSKTKEEGKDNVASKEKTEKKPSAGKKDVSSSSKKQKTPKDDGNGKKKRFKNKKEQTFNLNASGGVYAKIDNNDNIKVLVKNNSDDMNIEKDKWQSMAKMLGAGYSGWYNARVKNINFIPNGIYLPSDSSDFFYGFKGKINGCEKLNTSKVTDMSHMFEDATLVNPDVSKWNTSKVTGMSSMFGDATLANPDVSKWNTSKVTNMHMVFFGSGIKKADFSKWDVSKVMESRGMLVECKNLEYVKTPVGLRTDIDSANSNFKIVKLKRGSAAVVESESQNLNNRYTINSALDKNAAYHIYRKDKYAGVTFDKNDGDSEAWVNHEIVENGKSIVEDNNSLAIEEPKRLGYEFLGWTTERNVASAKFDENTKVNQETTVYALWKKEKPKSKYEVRFEANGGTGNIDTVEVNEGDNYKLPECTFTAPDGKEFDKWSVTVGSAQAVDRKPGESIVASDNVTVIAVWKNKPIPKVNITFNSDGGAGAMDAVTVDKDSSYTLPISKFTPPAGMEFDKWSVTIGSAQAVDRKPGESIVASDNVVVKAVWKAKEVPVMAKVTLHAEDVAGYPKDIKVTKGENLVGRLPMDLEKDGYTFLGWSKTEGTTEADFDASLPVTEDLTLYAVFKKNVAPPALGKTRVTLDGNGGVLAGGAEANIDIENGDTIKAQLEAAVANEIFTKPGYKFVGFSKSRFAVLPDYNLDSPVYYNTTLYAVYEEAHEVTKVTIKYTEVAMQEDEVIENVPLGKAIGSKLDGHEKHRDGYRFLGYSKVNGAVKPDFFKKSIVTRDMVIYPVYKKNANDDEVVVSFNANGGEKAPKAERIPMYDSLGAKMPGKENAPVRDGYLFTGWAKSKSAKYPDFFRSTVVKGDMMVYVVWKSLYNEKLGRAVLKVSAKAKGYELTIEPPAANLHTGFEIFRSEKKDFKPGSDTKIATVDRDTLKYLDEKADNGKAYYYAVRAIDADGSYNGTKVTFIGKLSDKILAAPLPRDKGVTATIAGKGAVSLEFNKTVAAAKYKVIVTAPYDKKFKTIERFVEADKLVAATAGKVKANITGLPMGKFLAFKLEALEADNTKLVEYGNSFAFMLGAPEKLTAKVNKKKRVLNIRFKAMKGVSGYEAKIVINGKVKTIKLKKGKNKLRGLIVGSIKLPKKKGNYIFTFRAFKKIGKLKYYGQTITKVVR